MRGKTKIEFYLNGSDKHIAVTDADAVPRAGEIVNIRKRQYEVTAVKWCVDNADDVMDSSLRACVEITEAI